MYNSKGDLINQFGEFGEDLEEFKFQSKLWVVDNKLYIADTRNNRIKAYSPEGKVLFKFGQYGRGPGELRTPGGQRYFTRDSLNQTNCYYINATGDVIDTSNDTKEKC